MDPTRQKSQAQIAMEAKAVAKARADQQRQAWLAEQRARLQFAHQLTAAKEQARRQHVNRAALATWEAGERTRFEAAISHFQFDVQQQFNLQVTRWLVEQPRITAPMMKGADIVQTAFKHGGIFAAVQLGAGLDVDATYFANPYTVKHMAETIKFEAAMPTIHEPTIAAGAPAAPDSVSSQLLEAADTQQRTMLENMRRGKFFVGDGGEALRVFAGTVANVEAPVYSVANLLGVKGVPKVPPTLTGALFSTGFHAVTTGELSAWYLAEAGSKGIGYNVGSLVGDVLLSYIIGKGVQKLLVDPLAKTRAGQYVGYQFKTHAPKTALRVVYGKRGAEYIVAERVRLPAEEFKDMFTAAGTAKATFPLVSGRGKAVTPMKTTLAKLARDTKGTAQILQPLGKLAYPEIPMGVQFGFTPFAGTLPSLFGAGVLGALQLTRARTPLATQKTAPSIAAIPQLKLKRQTFPLLMPGTAARLQLPSMAGYESAVTQTQQLKQLQHHPQILLQKQTLELKQQLPRLDYAVPKRKRRGKRGLRGAWGLRAHKVVSPEQLTRTFFGKKKQGGRTPRF